MLKTPRCSLGPAISTPTSWSRKDDHVQLSYELSDRVHSAEFYPLRAPNGSQIIVYGHEHGLTCMWKGGRPFKQSNDSSAQLKIATSSALSKSQNDVIMIDDDDDIEAIGNEDKDADLTHFNDGLNTSAAAVDHEEVDSAQPFDPILRSLNIALDAAVLHVSFPPLSPDSIVLAPSIFEDAAIVAAGCADGSIHVVSIPLEPTKSADPNDFGVQDLLVVEPSASTRDIPTGISLTWTAALSLSFNNAYPMLYSDEAAQATSTDPRSWSLLLACLTPRRSGILRVFEVPLTDQAKKFSPKVVNTVREVLLPAPAKSISFNSAIYPYETHTQILLNDNLGGARVYEPILRQASQALATPDLELHRLGDAWLASLYAPFERTQPAAKGVPIQETRMGLLDAKWAFDGLAIIVLLDNGQWGIWDIAGVGPGPRQNLLVNESTMTGLRISGGGVTRFALRGYIGHSLGNSSGKLSGSAKTSSESTAQSGASKLAPMTPNTRKSKQDSLFDLPQPTRPASAQSYSIGGISLSRIPADASNDDYDESLFLWYNSEIFFVPSLMSYWQNAARTNSLPSRNRSEDNAGTLFGPNFASFQSLSAEGEMITNISQTRHQTRPSPRPSSSQTIRNDVLVSAEHRLLLFCPIKQRFDPSHKALDTLFHPPASQPIEDGPSKRADQELLQRGELDLGTMDKMLDTMERRATLNGSRRVGFSANH